MLGEFGGQFAVNEELEVITLGDDVDGVPVTLLDVGHGQGVLWFKGPKFVQIEIDPKILFPHSLDLADLDNDGDIDAVTCSKDPVDVAAWYENNGKGRFTRRVIAAKQGSYDTRAIDMDGDGDKDILIAGHTSNNVVWFENPLK